MFSPRHQLNEQNINTQNCPKFLLEFTFVFCDNKLYLDLDLFYSYSFFPPLNVLWHLNSFGWLFFVFPVHSIHMLKNILSLDDVEQGKIADCWMTAGLVLLAEYNHHKNKNRFCPIGR